MNKGKIIQIAGPVVDVEFTPGQLPHIREALELRLEDGRRGMGAAANPVGNSATSNAFISSGRSRRGGRSSSSTLSR